MPAARGLKAVHRRHMDRLPSCARHFCMLPGRNVRARHSRNLPRHDTQSAPAAIEARPPAPHSSCGLMSFHLRYERRYLTDPCTVKVANRSIFSSAQTWTASSSLCPSRSISGLNLKPRPNSVPDLRASFAKLGSPRDRGLSAFRDRWCAQVEGVAFDGRPDNEIHAAFGVNMLKGRVAILSLSTGPSCELTLFGRPRLVSSVTVTLTLSYPNPNPNPHTHTNIFQFN